MPDGDPHKPSVYPLLRTMIVSVEVWMSDSEQLYDVAADALEAYAKMLRERTAGHTDQERIEIGRAIVKTLAACNEDAAAYEPKQ